MTLPTHIEKVKAVATAFNTNVDAVLKINGRRLAELARETGLDWQALTDGLPSLEGLEQIPDDRDKQQLQQNECGSQGRIKDAQSGSGE